MSARLNMNEIPLISWKGKTFNQITSKIQLNSRTDATSKNIFFKGQPLKIYRREIVTNDSNSCDSRLSSSIDLLNSPNGSIINSTAKNNHNGLENTLDINLTENKTERFYCNTSAQCFNPASNALRRLRSGGMIKRQFDVSKNNDTYATSTNQYLVSRNRTFQQNQYNYIKKGDSAVTPGDPLSKQNVYAASGINHCQKYYLPVDTSFQYQWFEAYQPAEGDYVGPQTYTVDLSAGYYTVADINARFQYVMSANCHYLVNASNKSHLFFMNFLYNIYTDKVELQVQNISSSIFPYYTLPIDPNKLDGSLISTWSIPSSAAFTPVVIINDNIFKSVIGFQAARYPNYMIAIIDNSLMEYDIASSNPTNNSYVTLPVAQLISSTLSVFKSSTKPEIKPLYIPLYYKPSNPKFAQQGGVSSSSLVCRKKYDTITCNTEIYRSAYGLQVANAMAYGVPANGYTIKDKIGYPMTKTPVFNKYSDEVKCCTNKTFNG